MTAEGEGCEGGGEGGYMTCGVEDQSQSLLKSPIPVVQTVVDRQGGPQPDHPERSSCKSVLRELSFPCFLRAP